MMHPQTRLKDRRPKDEVCPSSIRGLDPRREFGKMKADLPENFIAIDEIEGVLEVELQDALLLLRDVGVVNQGVDGMDDALTSASDADRKLERLEKVSSARSHLKGVALGGKTTQRFSHGNWAVAAILLESCKEVCP